MKELPIPRQMKIKSRIEFHLKQIKRQLKKMNLRSNQEILQMQKETLMGIISRSEFLKNFHIFEEYLKCEQGKIKLKNEQEIENDLIRVVKGIKKSPKLLLQEESIDEEVEETMKSEQVKNRKGQRQRRKEYELKYGSEAKHLKFAKVESKEKLHPSWEAKKREKLLMQSLPMATKTVFE